MRNVLILGGTGWLGRAIAAEAAEAAEAADDRTAVTALARGDSGEVPRGVRLISANRSSPRAYDAVSRQEWDEVIELSYGRAFVSEAVTALAENARHWTLISSVSVYARNDEPGADETAELVEPAGENDDDDYPRSKVAAERITGDALGDRLLIVRPGLVAGSGDPSDRFGYGVARFASARGSGSPVLIPETGGRPVQIIDVVDLAAFVVGAGLRSVTGTFNAVGTAWPFDDVRDKAASASEYRGGMVAARDDRLIANGVNYWAGPRSLPLWLPSADRGFMVRDNAKFVAAAGEPSALVDTIGTALVDERRRGLSRDRRAGLTRGDELELLARLARGDSQS